MTKILLTWTNCGDFFVWDCRICLKEFKENLWYLNRAECICKSLEFAWRLPCLGMDNEIHADSYYKTIKRQHYHSISTRNYPFILDCDNTWNVLHKQIKSWIKSFSVRVWFLSCKARNRHINLFFLLHCTGLAFVSACSKVTPFNNLTVGYRVLFHSQWYVWLFFSFIIDSNKKSLKTAFVFYV